MDEVINQSKTESCTHLNNLCAFHEKRGPHCSSDTTGTRLHNPTYIISHKIKTLIFFFKFLHQVLHIHDMDAVSGVAIQAPQSHHRLSVLELKTSTPQTWRASHRPREHIAEFNYMPVYTCLCSGTVHMPIA